MTAGTGSDIGSLDSGLVTRRQRALGIGSPGMTAGGHWVIRHWIVWLDSGHRGSPGIQRAPGHQVPDRLDRQQAPGHLALDHLA
ncbi:unnamed protein product [Staurois parvus]|uniref:Uncharacterized protein n=1 Tax=Staurois parvus TaxID=386267 RepID=A0ABN9DK07_9NEOB|nr:unnamed protein product [Staurois parvus]